MNRMRVLTYNILSPKFASVRDFPKTNPKLLEWEYRWPLIRDRILREKPDVVCVQEEWEMPDVPGYTVVRQKTTKGQLVRCAILYRNGMVCKPIGSTSRSISVELDGIAVSSCHLATLDREDERVRQLQSMLKKVGERKKHIIGGDFNSEQEDASHALLSGTYVSAYKKVYGHDPITYKTAVYRHMRLDYIYVKGLLVHSADKVRNGKSRPNEQEGSDHTPVIACVL